MIPLLLVWVIAWLIAGTPSVESWWLASLISLFVTGLAYEIDEVKKKLQPKQLVLEAGEPVEICEECGGKGCGRCNGNGYVPHFCPDPHE